MMPMSDEAIAEAVRDLWERGFHVIPLGASGENPPEYFIHRCGDVEEARLKWPKTPRIQWKEYQVRQPTEQEIEQWWSKWPQANVAICTGSIIVVDADNAEAVKWCEEHLPRTPWQVKTQRGDGRHFYFKRNPKLDIRNSANAKAKIDIRGFGGYVVVPPSRTPNGAWEWLDTDWLTDDVDDLPTLSADDLSRINTYNTPKDGNLLNVDLSGVKYSNQGQAVPEGERNNAAASLAGKYIHQGMSIVEVQQAMHAWNAQNANPLATGEINTVVASVARTHSFNNPGQPVPLAPEPPKPIPLIWFSDMQANLNTTDFVEDTLCDSQMSVIYGESNTGKTFLALDMALHVAMGQLWHGKQTEPGGVIYVAGEGGVGVANRIQAFKNHYQLNNPHIPFAVIPTNINLLTDFAQIELFIQTINETAKQLNQPVKLIVIDTLSRALAGGNENSSEDMGLLVINADKIRAQTKSHVCFIHHSGKDAAKGARGHSLLRAATDTEIEVIRENGITYATATKQREIEAKEILKFTLQPIQLGTNKRNKPISSCVVIPALEMNLPPKLAPKGPFKKSDQALVILKDLYAEARKNLEDDGRDPSGARITLESWRMELEAKKIISGTPSAIKKAWQRVRETLLEDGSIGTENGFVWIVEKRTINNLGNGDKGGHSL